MDAPQLFTAEQVFQLTGLSKRQLSYWDRSGFFTPQYADENRRRPFSRIYSFRDLVGLRTIAILRKQYGIPLQQLRRFGAWLAERAETPWASLTFYVAGRELFFDDPITGARMSNRPAGQTVLPIEMRRVVQEVTQAARRLRERKPEDVGRVATNKFVAHNTPVLAGTRVPTAAVWSFHRAGYDDEQIIREYPQLTVQDLRAAIAFEQARQRTRRPRRKAG